MFPLSLPARNFLFLFAASQSLTQGNKTERETLHLQFDRELLGSPRWMGVRYCRQKWKEERKKDWRSSIKSRCWKSSMWSSACLDFPSWWKPYGTAICAVIGILNTNRRSIACLLRSFCLSRHFFFFSQEGASIFLFESQKKCNYPRQMNVLTCPTETLFAWKLDCQKFLSMTWRRRKRKINDKGIEAFRNGNDTQLLLTKMANTIKWKESRKTERSLGRLFSKYIWKGCQSEVATQWWMPGLLP